MSVIFPAIIKNGFFQIIPTEPFNETDTNYQDKIDFIFPGTNEVTISKFVTLLWNDAAGMLGSIRIFDNTNSQVIAEKSIATTSQAISDLGTISNLPEDPAVFKVQLKKLSGGTPLVDGSNFQGLNIYY